MKKITRRSALKTAAATFAAPFVWRLHAHAAPSETVLHASFGASGMAGSDIGSLTASIPAAPRAQWRSRLRSSARSGRGNRAMRAASVW